MTKSFTESMKSRILERLETGVESGRVELSKSDCEGLLFILRTSVPLEPFLETFVEMISETVDDFYKRGGKEDGSQ